MIPDEILFALAVSRTDDILFALGVALLWALLTMHWLNPKIRKCNPKDRSRGGRVRK